MIQNQQNRKAQDRAEGCKSNRSPDLTDGYRECRTIFFPTMQNMDTIVNSDAEKQREGREHHECKRKIEDDHHRES